MTSYNLTLISKNKNSLNSSFLFLFNLSTLNFKIVIKYFQKQIKKNFITILKSPHINKKAQEQFETRFYSKQLYIYSSKKLKYLFFFKKIQNNIFSDVKIKIKISINHTKKNEILAKLLEPQNYLELKNNENSSITNLNFNSFNSLKIFKVLDSYGEFSIIN
jgi:ribosomal protein S10